MFQCFHCLQNTVCWECDYDYEDFGYEGEGIVHILRCSNCDSEIEYRVPANRSEKEKENEIRDIRNG